MGNRDQPVADYVRKLLSEYEANPENKLNALARRAGISKSMPSQVKRGLGVSTRSRAGFARAFGMTEEQLIERAYAWWLKEGKTVAEKVVDAPADNPELAEAIQTAKDWRQATDAEIRTILDAYKNPLFEGRGKDFWVPTLLEELKRIREKALRDELQEKETKKAQKKLRGLAEKVKEAKEKASLPPAPKSKPAKERKRKTG